MRLFRLRKALGIILFMGIGYAAIKFTSEFLTSLAIVILVLCSLGIIAHEICPKWDPWDYRAKRREKKRRKEEDEIMEFTNSRERP